MLLEEHLGKVMAFHMKVTGLPMPDAPTLLVDDRRDYALKVIDEERQEFIEATTVADQADALVDLIYFCYGRLLEMGIKPGPAFDLVHSANMAKERGANKRGDVYEAAKPAGWFPPDWDAHLRGQYAGLTRRNNPWDGAKTPRKKILLLGYGRHGKDTVAEMLRAEYGYSFTSSSMFCAERVMMPQMGDMYSSTQECFDDRHNHRATWFKAIEEFNTPDKASLGRAIFAEHDIYCGLRSAREFAAVKNSGLYDACIWVDRSQHVPPEDKASCTVEPWMADYILDNNGTLEELAFNLRQLMEGSLAAV